MMLNSDAEQQQRQHRADAGRRQRRQHRDRMDVALVEHAEHDVDRRRAPPGSAAAGCSSDCWKACAVPWNVPWIVAGMPISRIAPSIAPRRVAQRLARRQVERDRAWRRTAPWWLTESGVVPGSKCAKADSGTIVSGVVLTAAPVEARAAAAFGERVGRWLRAASRRSASRSPRCRCVGGDACRRRRRSPACR